ncbi:MAG TPA: ferritin-like domain-containing protein [Dehalococcoidia bacterium]
MAIDVDTLQKLRQETEVPPMDLSWLNLDDTWGVQAKPGKRGLTLDEVNIGPYSQIPDQADNHTLRLRGVRPRPGNLRFQYTARDKSEVWSENCIQLYEEAVQRQWSSATDIPWETIQPLPDDIERAICQLCTFLTEVEFIAGDTPGQWMPYISGEYYEAGLFLMTQIMDEARHEDVFRKRALANGGGLLQQSRGAGLRKLIEARDFTEMSVLMHVQAEGFVQSMFRMGELIGQNEAEKRIFRLCAQDESRHLAFGVMHLKYILDTEPERREEIHAYLDKAEQTDVESGGFTFDSPMFGSLALLLGGGKQNFDEGVKRFMAVRRKQINEYIHRLQVAGLGDRIERVNPQMRAFIESR